jgi:hypothetical protein
MNSGMGREGTQPRAGRLDTIEHFVKRPGQRRQLTWQVLVKYSRAQAIAAPDLLDFSRQLRQGNVQRGGLHAAHSGASRQ